MTDTATELQQLIADLNIPKEKLLGLVESFKTSPMEAFAAFQSLELAPEKVQALMQFLMANPNAAKDLASQYGVDPSQLDSLDPTKS